MLASLSFTLSGQTRQIKIEIFLGRTQLGTRTEDEERKPKEKGKIRSVRVNREAHGLFSIARQFREVKFEQSRAPTTDSLATKAKNELNTATMAGAFTKRTGKDSAQGHDWMVPGGRGGSYASMFASISTMAMKTRDW